MLELKNISFGVSESQGKKEILKGISLTIEDDKFVVITGPNGGGKTSLVKAILGTVPYSGSIELAPELFRGRERLIGYMPQISDFDRAFPISLLEVVLSGLQGLTPADQGQILFDGKDITDMNVTDRANAGISFAFQQPVRFKGVQVLDLIRLAAKKQLSIADACAYLSEVGLCAKDYINREVNGSLSGGELKRIEIATVLARGTKLSVFDEPEAGIDLWSFQNLIRVFENMRETTKGSILIISHQERILEIADEIVVISGGSVLKHGTREEILPEILGTSSAQGGCEFYRRDN